MCRHVGIDICKQVIGHDTVADKLGPEVPRDRHVGVLPLVVYENYSKIMYQVLLGCFREIRRILYTW